MNFGQLIEHKKKKIFFKKKYYEVTARGLQFSFNIFSYPSTWHTIKTNCIKLQITDPETNFHVFRKGSGIVSGNTFYARFFKIVSSVIGFTSRDIAQYVYFNCLLTRLQYHKFRNESCLSNQAVLYMTKKSREKS